MIVRGSFILNAVKPDIRKGIDEKFAEENFK